MTIKSLFLGFFITLMCYMPVLADQTYKEKITPEGKVISGLSAEEALNKFGTPVSTSGKLWYYGGPEKLYVYLQRPLEVYLYPRFYKGYVGVPLEIKVFAGSAEISDVTTQSELLLSKPDRFDITGEGVVVPKKLGDYQIMAIYKGRRSNTSFISIVEAKKAKAEEEKLVSLEILPYKPYGNIEARIDFFAFGTFVTKTGYIVRDVTVQAEWFTERNNRISRLKNSRVILSSSGKFRVFCSYKDLQSLPQDAEVVMGVIRQDHSVKHISIIPAYLPVAIHSRTPLRAFASYYDNRIEEVTSKVEWQINDKEILGRELNTFIANSVGISEVYANLENVRSLAAKFIVSSVPVSNEYLEKAQKIKKAQKPRSPEKNIGDMLENVEGIKEDIKDLRNKLNKEEKFRYIKVIPDYYEMRAGEEKQFSAFGVRQDDTEEDITILGTWKGLDNNIAAVNKGLVKAISPGETKVYVQHKDLESPRIPVIVGGPKLVSISVFPLNLKLVRGERSTLAAEGYFSDSSHGDISLLASWVCSNPAIAKMNKNTVKSLRVGLTKIYAEHSGIQSPPVEVEVIREKYWLLKLIAKTAFFLFLASLLFYTYFYMLIKRTRKNIIKLYDNPRDLILALYSNLIKVMYIFGMRQKFYTPPLLFANLVDKKYAIEDSSFFRLTERFEEAKYSTHSFSPEASRQALDDYNRILKIVFTQHKRSTLVYRYSKALVNKVPLFI